MEANGDPSSSEIPDELDMQNINPSPGRKEVLATGLAGPLGAFLLFAGDMLLYGRLGSGMEFDTRGRQGIVNASSLRLFAAGLLGPCTAEKLRRAQKRMTHAASR